MQRKTSYFEIVLYSVSVILLAIMSWSAEGSDEATRAGLQALKDDDGVNALRPNSLPVTPQRPAER